MTEGPVLSTVDVLLLEAAKKGDALAVRSALSDGAKRDAMDEKGKTAMCYAMEGTHADQPWPRFPKVVEALQEHMQRKTG